jgi:hypothetical protein
MQTRKLTIRGTYALILALVIVLGIIAYLATIDRRSQYLPVSASTPSGVTKAKQSPTGPGASVPAPTLPEGKKSPRSLLCELLERHAGQAFLAGRELDIPYEPPDSHREWREFWSFISELKLSLGEEAVPTLKALVEESESSGWKNLYLAMIVALKDPQSEPLLVSWSKDPQLPISQRMRAIYGLGMVGTPSSWEAFKELWPEIKRGKPDSNLLESLRWGAFTAMGAFGKQGATMLLEEVQYLNDHGHPDICGLYLSLARDADPSQLEKLAREGSSANLRRSAMNTLSENLASAGSLNVFMGLILQDSSPELRQLSAARLAVKMRMGRFSFENSPEALERIIANYKTLPAELQLALHLDPAARKLVPDTLEQFAATPAAGGSDWWMRYLLGAGFAADASTHPKLAQHILYHWKEGALSGARETFFEKGNEFTDPDLAAVIAKMATDPEFKESSGLAWEVLSKGPPEVRQESLRQASAAYWGQSENDKLVMIGHLSRGGPDAQAVLLGLLKQESLPVPRIELASTLLASGLGSGQQSLELRNQVAQDLAPVLRGESEAGIRYITSHPQGLMKGLDNFAALVRDYFSRCGSSAQISEIKNFPDRLFIPQKMIDGDPENALFIRDKLREVVLQSVDEIRRRESMR